jgi:hypothetical protein
MQPSIARACCASTNRGFCLGPRHATGGSGSTFQFNPCLHHLPWPEGDGASRGHDYLFPRARVAGLPSFPPPYLEDAKVAEFDSAFLNERGHDDVEGLFEDLHGLEQRKAKLVCNRSGDILPGHEAILLAWAHVLDQLVLWANDSGQASVSGSAHTV